MATLGELKVKITGDTSSLDQSLGSIEGKLRKFGSTVESAGRKLTTGLTLPLAGAAATAVESFRRFDDAITGVRKTVDASNEEFAQLTSDLEAMTLELPSTITEIGGVAEAAGQLGVATEDITSFTKTMIDLGETTNINAVQAAIDLARLTSVMGTSAEDTRRLGDAIVDLGNNFEASESEIVEMSARLSGAATTVGMAETDVLGLATALVSVGINAEAGGTAFSRVMTQMQIATDKGGAALDAFAETAGMTVGEFADLFEKDAAAAITAFIQGLNRMNKSGESVNDVLDETSLSGIRVRDALLRSAAAGDKMNNTINTAETAWRENNALTKEANLRYGTLSSQLQILRNRVEFVARDIGRMLVPNLLKMLDAGADLIEKWKTLSSEQKGFVLAVASLVAGLGPLLIVVGKVSTALSILVGFISPLVSALGSLVSFVGSAGTALTGLGSTLGGLVAGGGALTVFAGMARAIIQNWEALVEFFDDFKDTVVEIIEGTVETIENLWEDNKEFVLGIFGSLTQNIANILSNGAKIIIGLIEFIVDGAMLAWGLFGDGITDTLENALRIATNALVAFGDFVDGWVQFFVDLAHGDWDGAWNSFGNIVVTAWRFISNTVLNLVNQLVIGLQSALSWAPWLGPKIEAAQEELEQFINERIKRQMKEDIDGLKNDVEEGVDGAAEATKKASDKMEGSLRSLLDQFGKTFESGRSGSATSVTKKGAEEIGDALDELRTVPIENLKAQGLVPLEDEFEKTHLSSEKFTDHTINELPPAMKKAANSFKETEAETAKFRESIEKTTERIEGDFERALSGGIESMIGGDGFKVAVDSIKRSMISLVSEGIAKTALRVLKGDDSFVGAFETAGKTVWNVVKSITGSGGLLSGLGKLGGGLASVVGNVGGFIGRLVSGGGGSSLLGALGSVGSGLRAFGSKALSVLGAAGPWGIAIGGAIALGIKFRDQIGAAFSAVWKGIVAGAKFMWEGVKKYFEFLKNFWKTVAQGVVAGAKFAWKGAKKYFEFLKNFWGTVFGGLKSIATGAFNAVVGAAKSAASGILNAFKGIAKGIGDAFKGIGGFIGGLFGGGDSKLEKLVKKTGVPGIMAEMAEKDLRRLAKEARAAGATRAQMFSAVQQVIKAFQGKPGRTNAISKIVSALGFAQGGVAFGPTLGVIGDNMNAAFNPEVVAPLSDLQDIMMRSMPSVAGAGMSQTIVVKLDGREIARSTAENLPEYLEVLNLR